MRAPERRSPPRSGHISTPFGCRVVTTMLCSAGAVTENFPTCSYIDFDEETVSFFDLSDNPICMMDTKHFGYLVIFPRPLPPPSIQTPEQAEQSAIQGPSN